LPCKGTNLSYRIYVGEKYMTVDKLFNGHVPYGTKRLCFIKDQVNRADDTLKVSVEILESHREIEHVIDVPPEPLPPAPGVEPPEKPLEGVILFHRHVNNRLFEQVKHQADMMRSRMVRRIEWRVEQASRLRACFPAGDCICSTQFNAAGIEGLQLLFYPSGYNGATEGFCSLYLYGPAGCTLRCWLCLGAQKREAHHSFEQPGAFGRTNFCRFDAIVEDDIVLVALEIDEAHQDVVAQVANPSVVPGDRRSLTQIDGSNSSAIQSAVKLQVNSGRVLEDTRVLPSLWTAAFPDGATNPNAQPPEGTYSFDELKRPGRGGRRSGAQAPTAPFASATDSLGMRPLKSSESMPSLRDAPPTSHTTLESTGTLPRMARTDAGFEGAMSTKPRRARRGLAATTTSSLGIAAC